MWTASTKDGSGCFKTLLIMASFIVDIVNFFIVTIREGEERVFGMVSVTDARAASANLKVSWLMANAF